MNIGFLIKNKRVVWVLAGTTALLLILLPLHNAKAAWWEFITALPSALVTFIFWAMLWIGQALLTFSNWLLGWAVSNPFSLSATNPATNPIINAGWTLTRDLTNMLFILGLAYIGLATALNISNFNTKKTFARLIIAALLINFSPVICGVILDLTNLIAGYFLQGIDFSILTETYSAQRGIVTKNITDIITEGGVMMQALMLMVYAAMGAGIFFLFALLFLVRLPVIWILVILAPLAIFFAIFDKTKKYYEMWKGQFVTWSMIAIPAGFFLYLSQHAIVAAGTMLKQSAAGGAGTVGGGGLGSSPDGGFFGSIAPYFIAILFLIFGLIFALQINAMGSGAIIGLGKKYSGKAKAVASKAGKKVLKAPVKAPGAAIATGAGIIGAGVGAVTGLKASKGQKWYKRVGGTIKGAGRGAGDYVSKEKELMGAAGDAGFRALERAHLIRPGFAEERRQKKLSRELDEEKKRLRRLPKERQDAILERIDKAIITTKAERTAAAAILEIKADNNDLNTKHSPMIKKYKKYGISMNSVFKAEPGWIADFPEHANMLDFDKLSTMRDTDIKKIAGKIDKEFDKLKNNIIDIMVKKNTKFVDKVSNLVKDGKTNQANDTVALMKEVAAHYDPVTGKWK